MRLVFPLLQMAMALGAAIVYAYLGEWRHAIYWVAAAVLTGAVTSL